MHRTQSGGAHEPRVARFEGEAPVSVFRALGLAGDFAPRTAAADLVGDLAGDLAARGGAGELGCELRACGTARRGGLMWSHLPQSGSPRLAGL